MNLDRLRWGEWIAAIAGLDLILVTFRAWYKLSGGGARVTAWDALTTGRYLLIAAGVVGVFFLLIRAAEDAGQLGELPLGWIVAVVGFATTVYVAYRLATPPSDNVDPDIGLYFGLAGALLVAIGGVLAAREETASPYAAGPAMGEEATAPAPGTEPLGALVPDSGSTYSAAPPAATTGWSPAAGAVPPATAAGAGMAGDPNRPVRPGDHVALTTGGARFPAGTIAEVIEVFAGGALVEVRAPDGVADRFEVPESAFERVPAGGAATPTAATTPSTEGESWSPAMPAPAGQDWGFDEPGAAGAGTAVDEPGAEAEPAKKAPWWKREIGGGKKGEGAEIAAAAAAGALATHELTDNGAATEERPGFFKRLFGGGAKADQDETVETEAATPEAETTPATDVSGMGQAAESDTAIAEPPAEEPAASEPAATTPEPGDDGGVSAPAASAADAAAASPATGAGAETPEGPAVRAAEASAADAAPAAASDATADEPAGVDSPAAESAAAAAGAAAAEASAAEPAPAADPEPAVAETPTAPEPVPAPPEPEPAPAAPEPVEEAPPAEPEPAPAPPEPESAPPAPEPAAEAESVAAPDASSAPAADVEAAGAGAAAAAAAGASADDEEPKPKPAKRRRSSGSRKVPKAAVEAASTEGGPPKVGDQVELKVAGGKYDVGTKGTVVDVFSAGVIVELSDDEGRTERLDLPFEAVGPADA